MTVSSKNGDCVVGMNSHNGKRAFIAHLGLISMGTTSADTDLIADLEVAVFPASILADQTGVNLALTWVVDGDEICNERDIEVHISVEDNSAR